MSAATLSVAAMAALSSGARSPEKVVPEPPSAAAPSKGADKPKNTRKAAPKPAAKPTSKPTPKPTPKPTAAPKPTGPLYQNDLEKLTPGAVPGEFLVLGGEFTVVKDEKNNVIELPGEPVDAFGLLFGPTIKKEPAMARLRSFGTKKGRRAPSFAVGLFGISGYKLRCSPAAGKLEILKDEEIKISQPHEWKSEIWIWLKIQATPQGKDQWKVQGKVWEEGSKEPEKWMIEWTDSEAPPSGRASLIGAPYSGTPLRFDDLLVDKAVP